MNARARVLQVVLSLHPGGTERLVLELAKRVHPELPTHVCCLDEPGGWAPELAAAGVGVTTLGRSPGFQAGLGRRIAAVARDHRATVIHAHHYSPFVYSALSRLTRPSTRLVFTEHGRLSDAPPSLKRRFWNRLLSRLPHRVFAVSNDLKAHMVAEGFSKRQVGVVYNGIDPGPAPEASARARARARLGLDDETPVIVTVARLDPVKDLGTLFHALVSPGLASAQTIVIGDGPERAALEGAVAQRGLDGRVRFLGRRDDAREWLAGCDVYVNCSISEGVSLTILEAMAAGLPVVATAVGGTPEVVNASCGQLVPARDAASLASALEALVADAGRREALGRAGRARVMQYFTLDRMIAEYRASYLA